MPLIRIVLADHDFMYINHLAQWFIENKPSQFQISVFTEKESFDRFVSENGDRIDIILAAEDFLVDNVRQNIESVVLGQAVRLSGLPSVEKYQPAPSVCSEILSILSDSVTGAEKWLSTGKSRLIACFSTNTCLKSALAIMLASLSNDYVYINFESFPFYTLSDNVQDYGKNLSDILYHIKSRKSNPVMALESAVVTGAGPCSFIPQLDNPRDLWELTDNEIDDLTETLKSWGHFSKVIADLECNTGLVTMKMLEAASNILIPFDRTNQHQVPGIKNFLKSINGLNNEKVRWVFCGKSDELRLPEEPGNLFELPWLNGSIPVSCGFSIDSEMKNRLADLLENLG
ncbi:MAG: hypothetical protein GXZ01_03305 [Clostridiaceae bacterium]|jgi:hypothetical protein|nr:hypothetical protein [Clostridiaceae bacterium]